MARELEKHGNVVGSENYFLLLNTHGIVRRIMKSSSNIDYESNFKEVAKKVNAAARLVYDDLVAAGAALRFMETHDLKRLSTVLTQLEKLCVIANESLSCARDCIEYLELRDRGTDLQSRADVRDLERAYDILRGSGSYDLPDSRERIFEIFLNGEFFDESYATEEVVRFVSDLNSGNGQDQLRDLALYIRYREYPSSFNGRCGQPIGSVRYIDELESEIFGDRLYSHELSRGEYCYGDSAEEDLREIYNLLVDDIRATPYDECIIYENRERLVNAAEQLAKVTPHCRKSVVENYVAQYRRLEDFDNKVIEFETGGDVRAKMEWKDGKNIMTITADVYFSGSPRSSARHGGGRYDDEYREYRKKVENVKGQFKMWGGGYTVFNDQSLHVEVIINEKSSHIGAADVNFLPEMPPMRSLAWGGKGVFDWQPEDKSLHKFMNFFGDIDDNVAVHEFGHWLGLQDAYRELNAWSIPIKYQFLTNNGYASPELIDSIMQDEAGLHPIYGVDKAQYPDFKDYTIMANHNPDHSIGQLLITDRDIQMVVLAFQTGQRQNCQVQFPGNVISQGMEIK